MTDKKVHEFIRNLFCDLNYSPDQNHEYKKCLIICALDWEFNIFSTFTRNIDVLIEFIDDIVDINNIKNLDKLKNLIKINFVYLQEECLYKNNPIYK